MRALWKGMNAIISSYKDIVIRPQTLYVFDIDDTLLYFPTFTRAWWKDTTEKYKAVSETTADQKAHDEWLEAVQIAPGIACDKEGFTEIYKKIIEVDSKVILLTARPEFMKPLTLRHLREGLWEFHPGNVHFDKEKGARLRNILCEKYATIKHVAFVDDYEKNIVRVRDAFADTDITLDTYLYVHSW